MTKTLYVPLLLSAGLGVKIWELIIHKQSIYEISRSHKRDVRTNKCLFVLRFYGPVNPMGSCLAGSVYLRHSFTGQA